MLSVGSSWTKKLQTGLYSVNSNGDISKSNVMSLWQEMEASVLYYIIISPNKQRYTFIRVYNRNIAPSLSLLISTIRPLSQQIA